jgi:cbb3-type cytochrome oxidase subunit 3
MDILGISLDTLRGLVLIALMLGFGGICAWAWSGARRETFRHLSQLPLEEDDGRIPADCATRGAKE